MKIGIDFHSAEREGTGNCTYIRNLVESLLKIDNDNEYFLYVTDINYTYYNKFKDVSNVRLRVTRPDNPFVRIPLLGLLTFIDRIDVLHVQYISPPFYRGKLVMMIHDISFLHFPECFRKFERFRQRILLPLNITKADRIVTVSKFSRNDIIKSCNVMPEKIRVTYNGVDSTYKPLEDYNKAREALGQYGVSDKFIFFVGRLDARKNISALIKAFVFLKESKNISHKLVIAGKEDFMPRQIRTELKASKYKEDVIFTCYLPEEQLVFFYNMADVFVYPSLYEGFGLPCLEAIACGCPVVSSNISSIPEILNGSAIFVNPFDSKEIAEAVYSVISNPELRNELKNKGLKQAGKFRWEVTAEKTLGVYKELFNSRGF